MKWLLIPLLMFALPLSVRAITPAEIVRLVQLKSGDDVILKLISTNPLKKALTPSEVIYLKQNGVSKRIISSLLHVSNLELDSLPPQDGQSNWINESARTYYTTTKNGERRLVITNLDENGNRMGPPPPPRWKEPEPQFVPERQAYQSPQEIRVIVESQPRYEPPPSSVSYFAAPDYPPAFGSPVISQAYYPYGFIPDYPGSTFGFHTYPRFTIIGGGSLSGHRPFFQNQNCQRSNFPRHRW